MYKIINFVCHEKIILYSQNKTINLLKEIYCGFFQTFNDSNINIQHWELGIGGSSRQCLRKCCPM